LDFWLHVSLTAIEWSTACGEGCHLCFDSCFWNWNKFCLFRYLALTESTWNGVVMEGGIVGRRTSFWRRMSLD